MWQLNALLTPTRAHPPPSVTPTCCVRNNNKEKCLIKHWEGEEEGGPPHFMQTTINMQMSDDGFSQRHIPKWLAVALLIFP